MVTGGKSSGSRLTGDLQSSIGFSPKTINLKEPPIAFLDPHIPSKAKRRPQSPRRASSGAVATLDRLDSLSSGSTSASNETSGEDSSYDTANSSTSYCGQESHVLELHSPDGTTSPRKPKMMLVEVSFQNVSATDWSTTDTTPGQSCQHDVASHLHEEKWLGIRKSNQWSDRHASIPKPPRGIRRDIHGLSPCSTPRPLHTNSHRCFDAHNDRLRIHPRNPRHRKRARRRLRRPTNDLLQLLPVTSQLAPHQHSPSKLHLLPLQRTSHPPLKTFPRS